MLNQNVVHLKLIKHMCMLSCVRLFATSYTVACQVPLSIGLPRQDYWSGFPFPSSGDPCAPGIEPMSLALEGRFFTMLHQLHLHTCHFLAKIFPDNNINERRLSIYIGVIW